MNNSHKTSQKDFYSTNYENYNLNVAILDSSRFDKVYEMIIEETNMGALLEVGCLSGDFLFKLKNIGWSCTGVEISDAAIEGTKKGLDILKCDVENGLPFESEVFDVVYAGEIIEHLIDTDAFIKEVHRVLKQNGKFIITTPNIASLINRFLLLLGKYPRYLEYNTGGAGHIHIYNYGKITNQLVGHGFIVDQVVGNFLSFPDPTPNKILRKMIFTPLGNFLPTLSENLIIKSSKSRY